jgi:hypothetical protein
MIFAPRRPRISLTSVPRAPLIACTRGPSVFATGIGSEPINTIKRPPQGPGTHRLSAPQSIPHEGGGREDVDCLGSGASAERGVQEGYRRAQ